MNQSLIATTGEQTIKSDLNVSEILDDLLYRSFKPNPNREILVASTITNKSCNNNPKSVSRQRHPALLLPATHDNNITHSSLSSQRLVNNNNNNNNSNSNSVPLALSRQNSSNYWNGYPSESEFDTTRIDNYLNALNLSRRHRSQKSSAKQNVKPVRSRSVDTTLSRLRMSIHKPVNSLLSAISHTSPSGAKLSSGAHSGQSGANASARQSNRNALVTRSESLNSEGSSLSGESGICEFNSGLSHPAKSVLKKSSAANTVHIGPGKKNVTFSAFATIQVMEG